jgi:hypothetical protein
MKRRWMNENTNERKIILSGAMLLSIIEKQPDGDDKTRVLLKIKDAKKYHNPNADYGSNGFRFSDGTLEELGGHAIMFPVEWMAEYVNIEHKNGIDSNDEKMLSAINDLVKSSDLFYLFQQMKPHYIGLCAYAILHIKEDERVFNSALLFLDLYREYHLASVTNNRDKIQQLVDEHEKWIQSIN